MGRLIRLFFFSLILLTTGNIEAQVPDRGPMRSAMRILVFVRNPDDSPAPAGVSVRLEVDGGGLMDSQSTDSSGRVTFHPTIPTGYTIEVHQPGFKDASRHVDLTLTPTASVTLQLLPLPDRSRQPPAGHEGTDVTISSAELAIPEEARSEFEKGKLLLEEKHDVPGSRAHFQKAIKIDPNFVQAYILLGMTYLQDLEFDKSKTAINHALQLEPNSGPAYLALGACLNQQKDFASAEKALTKGLEIVPDSAEGHYEIGKAYWGLHRWQDADPHAQKAVQMLPNVPGTHVLMGNVLLQKRDAAGALKEFQEYLRLEPGGAMSDAVRSVVSKLQKTGGK
jgi:Flp pilus assembly protein TadD